MGAFASGFFLGRLLFAPFALRLLVLALVLGFASEVRYGVHERLLYWLTYSQLHQDDSYLVRLVDLNEPWLAWALALTYTGLAALFVISLARLVAIFGMLLEIILTGLKEATYWLRDGLFVGYNALVLAALRTLEKHLHIPVRIVLHDPEVLELLPADALSPKRVA